MQPKTMIIAHGYTIADLDALAQAACRADRSLASDTHTRYDTAWSAIALALAEADHWLRPESLIRTGLRAIYDEIRQMRRSHGRTNHNDPHIQSPRTQAYWYYPTTTFETSLVERLSIPPILATLTDAEREAVIALAVHDNYALAAESLNLKKSTFTVRLSAARRRWYRRWYYPDPPPPIRGTDRRIEAYGKTPATHCANGHEWTFDNTRWTRDRSRRVCRACERERKRKLLETP